MNKIALLLLVTTAIFSCTNKKATDGHPHVLIQTGMGDVEVELYPDKAPATVANFLQKVDAHLYKQASFYRVLKNDNLPVDANSGLIQGGIYHSNPTALAAQKGITHEAPATTHLQHESGTLSMARTTVGTATSEFFICIGDQPQFDIGADGAGFAAFGKVVQGMKVVRSIQQKASTGEAFDSDIRIDDIVRIL